MLKLHQIARFIHSQGARAGVQLAHAGRKGSMTVPFGGERLLTEEEGRWEPVGPSAIAFSPNYAVPKALDEAEIAGVVSAFADAARRVDRAGFDFVEIHGAHGYLLHDSCRRSRISAQTNTAAALRIEFGFRWR